jgi:hypothetical protein
MNRTGKNLAFLGVILQVGLLVPFGVAIGVHGTLNVFVAMGHPAASIGHMLALVGFILILIALNLMRYRARWFYACLWPICILWIISGVGLWPIFGMIMMVYLLTNAGEFVQGPRA